MLRHLSFELALDTAFAEAMSDFDATAWRPFLRSLDGNAPLPDQMPIYTACTGRTEPFLQPPRTAQATCGRRSGKTRIGSLLCATAAAFWDHSTYLARGERGRVMLLSQSKDQATVARGYILALLESNEVTAALIDGLTAEVITLNNSVDIVVTAASYRGVRGFSSPLILCDETSLWRDSESSVNPAKEIMRALAPGMASVSEPLMLSISTPWSKEGQHYETHTRNWGNNQSRVLAWQASSLTMNPTLDPRMIEDAYADDPEAARAEFGGEFRSDIATYVDRDVLMEAVEPERTVRGRMDGTRYYGFVDPSSGSKDSFVLAIAHREGDLAVLDVLQEHRPPFDPLVVIGECSKTLRSYGILGATGDRYAQGFVVSAFRSNGIAYNYSTRDRSQIYLDALPLLNARKARLLDNTRLVNQLAGLQRRSSASGRSTVDHARGGHDDAANGACGALVLAADLQTGRAFGDVGQVSITPRADPILDIGTGARNPATISATLTPVPSYDRFSPPQDW